MGNKLKKQLTFNLNGNTIASPTNKKGAKKMTCRIKYFYKGQWYMSGMMRLHDAIHDLPIWIKEYGKAEIIKTEEEW